MSLRLLVFVSARGYGHVRHDTLGYRWLDLTVGDWVEFDGSGAACFSPESKEASCSGDN